MIENHPGVRSAGSLPISIPRVFLLVGWLVGFYLDLYRYGSKKRYPEKPLLEGENRPKPVGPWLLYYIVLFCMLGIEKESHQRSQSRNDKYGS